MADKRLSDYDGDQIVRYTYDEGANAQRVTLVGMDSLVIEPKLDMEALTTAIKDIKIEAPVYQQASSSVPEIKVIEVPKIVIEPKIIEIEKPVVVTQEVVRIEKIEVPTVVEKIVIKEIEKPVYLYKPVAVEREKENSWSTVFQAFQALALLGMLIKLMLMK